MKKILGLDLGAASIGWALVSEQGNENDSENKVQILGMGSRIIPYEGTEGRDFSSGTGESRNSIRTKARTIRKGYDRYQLRRKYLTDVLKKYNMMPGEREINLTKMELWELRSKAAKQEITLPEFGRIMLLINQKRGYKSCRNEANMDKKDTEYVAQVKRRHTVLNERGITVGQYFWQHLCKDQYFRIKDNVFPREAYIDEFDKICTIQRKAHSVLTGELIEKIRDEIIFYQRQLKSQKGLVSVCELEGRTFRKGNKEFFVGPRVAPKSSPVFQLAKIWENINNIKINDSNGDEISISLEKKKEIYEHLDNNERLTKTDLLRILELKKDSCYVNKQIDKGIQGNTTKTAIIKCLNGNSHYDELMRFELKLIINSEEVYLYDKKTGEVLNSKERKYLDCSIEREPLYRLWHTIYSIGDFNECQRILCEKFEIDEITAGKLAALDFGRQGFGNKSVKAIRKILPYLMEGDCYSDALSYAGYDHIFSMTTEENADRKLSDRIKPIQKNSLRQPVVEKILNQMVNVVNSIIDVHGKPDEIRIELARELKQSKEERSDAEREINKRERENDRIVKLLSEFGHRATRNNIIKWRLYEEINNEEKKLNAMCIYCGQPISISEALLGNEVDVEHIIPKSRLFDDSQSNKTLAHRRCNANKGDMTAYDFMKGKSEKEFNDYIERVNNLYSNNIIRRSKRDKLLMPETKIPDNFIDRQLRESQYISRKAREVLNSVCRNVWCTSGQVTSELRHYWGWDDVLMNLQLPKYKLLELTDIKEWESENGRKKHSKEVIKDWSKRDDQRHHAVDALTIACTKQSYIQRFNTLNSSKTREDMYKVVEERSDSFREKLSLLEKFIISQKPIQVSDVQEAVSKVLISFKAGKKVAVRGTRKVGKFGARRIVQKNILVPRGPLSEESVYGRINIVEKKKPVKYLFENPHLILKPYIKSLVEERIKCFSGDVRKAIASLRKEPIYLDDEKKRLLEYGSCYKQEFVIKYPIDINFNKIDKVIDPKIKEILETRLRKFDNKPKLAFKDIQKEDESIVKWYEDEGLIRPIKSARCFTGLAAVVPVRKDSNGRDTGFVKPGNNHHVAFYSDTEGNISEHVCTFWHAVERKKYGLPVIIKNTNEIWDTIQNKEDGFYPESFLKMLPEPNLKLEISLQQNEMLILGMLKDDAEKSIKIKDYKSISYNLYRVQKLGSCDYTFRHHLETKIIDDEYVKKGRRAIRVNSTKALFALNPLKVKLDCIGRIINNAISC